MQRMCRSNRKSQVVLSGLFVTGLLLAGCDDAGNFNLTNALSPQQDTSGQIAGASGQAQTTERDVEAPEVFSTTEAGLWDGRPSLGGVWVAHPEVSTPERVRITNKANGEVTVGALFRRERENPGPRLQVSSDAAQALGMLAGSPVEMEVVALRKEVIETVPAEVEAPPEIEETTLDPVASTAEAAIEAAEAQETATTSQLTVASTLPEVALSRPYLQAAVFNNQDNAQRAVKTLTDQGLTASARKSSSSNREIWRVVVGPAQTPADRDAALAKVKAAGFEDAYPVSN